MLFSSRVFYMELKNGLALLPTGRNMGVAEPFIAKKGPEARQDIQVLLQILRTNLSEFEQRFGLCPEKRGTLIHRSRVSSKGPEILQQDWSSGGRISAIYFLLILRTTF